MYKILPLIAEKSLFGLPFELSTIHGVHSSIPAQTPLASISYYTLRGRE
jgi:hypothetical protein